MTAPPPADPAIAAAQRAWEKDGHAVDRDTRVPITAAREMAAPLRKLHRPVTNSMGRKHCANCKYEKSHDDWTNSVSPEPWPCAEARLLYSSDELGVSDE